MSSIHDQLASADWVTSVANLEKPVRWVALDLSVVLRLLSVAVENSAYDLVPDSAGETRNRSVHDGATLAVADCQYWVPQAHTQVV